MAIADLMQVCVWHEWVHISKIHVEYGKVTIIVKQTVTKFNSNTLGKRHQNFQDASKTGQRNY